MGGRGEEGRGEGGGEGEEGIRGWAATRSSLWMTRCRFGTGSLE